KGKERVALTPFCSVLAFDRRRIAAGCTRDRQFMHPNSRGSRLRAPADFLRVSAQSDVQKLIECDTQNHGQVVQHNVHRNSCEFSEELRKKWISKLSLTYFAVRLTCCCIWCARMSWR